jgi:hypothetical protein
VSGRGNCGSIKPECPFCPPANHSYQFNHFSAEAWGFYSRLKADLGFEATYSVPAIVGTISATAETTPALSQERLTWFLPSLSLQLTMETSIAERILTGPSPDVLQPALRSTQQRLAAIDDYFERDKGIDRRLAMQSPSATPDVVESLEFAFESLMPDEARG